MLKEFIEEIRTKKDIDKIVINDLREYVKRLEIKQSELFKLIECQTFEIGILTEENGLLKEELKRLKGMHRLNSENSSKPPSTDRKGKKKAINNSREKSGKKSGGQNGHEGNNLEISKEVDKVVKLEIRECQNCKENLCEEKSEETEIRQVFDLPKKLIEVCEYQTEKKTCKKCGCVNNSKFPEDVKNKTQYGNRIKAILVYFIQYQLISYKRLTEISSDIFGQKISEGTIYNANIEAYNKLEKSEDSIKSAIINEKVVNFDETGIRVNSLNYWIHVSCTKDYTFYAVDRNRSNKALQKIDILTKFKGVAIHDNYSMYFKYKDCSHGLCNAHHYRELKGAFDEDGFLWLSQMTDLLFRIKKAVDISENIDSLDTKQLFEFETEYKKILDEGSKNYPFIEISEKKRGRIKHSKSQNLLIRFIKRRNEILLFMYNFSVPFDNNQAERDIRMPKLKQKISGCFRSSLGAEIFCRNRGYISTIKKQNLNVLQSICDVFSNKPFTA